jgi:hypothetical protein
MVMPPNNRGNEQPPRRRNDALRELLEFVAGQVDRAHSDTKALPGLQSFRDELAVAIQELKDNPGPEENPTD